MAPEAESRTASEPGCVRKRRTNIAIRPWSHLRHYRWGISSRSETVRSFPSQWRDGFIMRRFDDGRIFFEFRAMKRFRGGRGEAGLAGSAKAATKAKTA